MFSCGLLHIHTPVLADLQKFKFISSVWTLDAIKQTSVMIALWDRCVSVIGNYAVSMPWWCWYPCSSFLALIFLPKRPKFMDHQVTVWLENFFIKALLKYKLTNEGSDVKYRNAILNLVKLQNTGVATFSDWGPCHS